MNPQGFNANLPPNNGQSGMQAMPQPPESSLAKKVTVIATICGGLIIIVAMGWVLLQTQARNMIAPDRSQQNNVAYRIAPKLNATTAVSGRNNVWGIGFLPTKEMLFTERKGTLNIVISDTAREIAKIADVKAVGEGGLMGLAVDPDFKNNRNIYTCFNTTAEDIKVVRWVVRQDLTAIYERKDIITGIPANPSGRHSGCQLAFGPDGYLWVGTGDTAQTLRPQSPQDPKSLAGKVLRVDRDGKAAPNNSPKGFDARIYSYGHRNVQGIAFFAAARNGIVGVSAEHGSDVDDELNPLTTGNFGWAPPDGPYVEKDIPMTDTKRFSDAVEAIWKSGSPTQAPSGVAVLNGKQWKAWDGAIVIAMLKAEHLKILQVNDKLKFMSEIKKFQKEYGRMRSVVQGPDGNLYIGTSNGKDTDRIIRITPS